jgi:hypothetical protein
MDRIIEYRIEVEETAGRMQIRMRDVIEAGWQPLGAPFYTPQNNVAQAVVKYAEDVQIVGPVRGVEPSNV